MEIKYSLDIIDLCEISRIPVVITVLFVTYRVRRVPTRIVGFILFAKRLSLIIAQDNTINRNLSFVIGIIVL